MAFDFAALKGQVRRTVHDTLAISAHYVDSYTTTPIELRVRWHSKINRFGDIENMGYSEVIDGINRLIFSQAELDLKGISLRRGGRVKFLSPEYAGVLLILDSEEPNSGPVTCIWNVAAT